MKIVYFASLRENIGKSEERVEAFSNLDDLRTFLVEKYPNAFDESIITAVNMEVVKENIPLTENDEVAFYPPVTGG